MANHYRVLPFSIRKEHPELLFLLIIFHWFYRFFFWTPLTKAKAKLHLCLINLKIAPWGCMTAGGIAPRILNLCTGWRWVVGFKPLPPSFQEGTPCVPFSRRLCGSQSWSGLAGIKKSPYPCRESNPNSPIIQSVAYPLYWMSCPGSQTVLTVCVN
jgi:hypothetical protein